MAATGTRSPEQVLTAARDNAAVIADAQVEQLLLALAWAELNPGDDLYDSEEWAMRPLELAGSGAPTIDESAVAEFALAVGMKHEPGARLIADALELCHRLPRVWARIVAGEVPVWKGRRIAEHTISLSLAAATAVDQHLAVVAKRCSFAEIQRQVERARAEHDPVEAEDRRLAAAEQRHLDIHLHRPTPDGLVAVEGLLEAADALALEAVIAARASTFDPQLPLDVRRAMAAGTLGSDAENQRELVIYTHARPDAAMVEVDTTRTVVTPEQIREWCEQAGTRVTVRPVLDLAEERSSVGHDPGPLLREQIILRYRHCIFPGCERLARACDLDHRIPWPLGPTTTWNLFPLCRQHHRLKTTGGWSYRTLDQHTIEWTSPIGWTHHRHTG